MGAEETLAAYYNRPHHLADFLGDDLTRDDVEFMRDRNRDHALRLAPELASALESLLDEVLDLQAEAYYRGYNQGFADGEDNVWNPQRGHTDKNPYTKEDS